MRVTLCWAVVLMVGASRAPPPSSFLPSPPYAHYGRRCATVEPSAERVLLQAAQLSAVAERRPILEARAQQQASQVPGPFFRATIPLVLHIFTQQNGNATLGMVPQSQIDEQLAVLNAAFAGNLITGIGSVDTGIRYELEEVLVYDESTPGYDAAWFSSCSPQNGLAIAAGFAVTPATHQNVFLCAPSNGLLGWTVAFPADSPDTSVFVLFSTLPGGDCAPYSMGRTLVHELGHSLGLLHTFQNGCGQPGADPTTQGDFVVDTPPEATPAFGVPSPDRDTCPGPLLGEAPWFSRDPTSSFLDYSDDSVMTTFSPGQAARMQLTVLAYRPALCAAQPAGYCEPPASPQPPPPSRSAPLTFASL